jgi:succinoglycan biosynthesis transport protein ExoP
LIEITEMNAAPFPSLTPQELVRLLLQKRKLLIIPAIVGGLLAAAYSLVTPRYWEASQGLVVRQETAGAKGPTPGKFADLYEMRTLQETILEVAKSKQVVVGTLQAVDQKLNGAAGEPDAEEIDKFRERLKMLPPHGGEFGKTEVFYFYVKDPSRERAIELVGELCRQLDSALKELRTERAQSLVAELQQQVNLASELNAEQTAKLSSLEKAVGTDLGELRMLHTSSSGQSDLRTEVVQLESDLRKFNTQVRETGELLKLLQEAQQDAQKLIATPNSLLTTQPALRQLKDGLIKAQIATAQLEGTRSAEHPQVQAAVESEKQIRDDLHRELAAAIQGAEVEQELAEQRVTATETRLHDLQSRLASLAEQRAEYANRVAAVENSRASLNQARHNLSTAKAAEAAAQGASLVTKIGQPETGPYPVGPGRTVITAAGAVAGLMLGAGLIFFSAGAPIERVSNEIVGVRPATPQAQAAAVRKPEFSKLEPAKKRPAVAEATAELFNAAEPSASPSAAVPQPWDVEVRPPAEHRNEAGTSAGLAAASKHLLGGGNRTATAVATAAPVSVAAASTATIAERKPSLPIPPGALPTTVGTLPLGGLASSPGQLSLQEAIHAAKQSAN